MSVMVKCLVVFLTILQNSPNKDGIEQRLSKMITKKSGGETQTPFYISVLASFAQLYHTNEEGEFGNTTRLIIFDEAFSKMDRNRLTEAVKLLRMFNLQAILSKPQIIIIFLWLIFNLQLLLPFLKLEQ